MGVAGVAIAAVVAGGLLKGVSSAAAGINAERVAKINADEADKDAELAIAESKFTARQERIQGEAIVSKGTAITGASGVKINRGSDLKVRQVNQSRLETSISNILLSGKVSAHKLRTQGAVFRAQGKAGKVAGFIGAGQSILQSVSQISSISSDFGIAGKLKSSSGGLTSSGLLDPSLGTASLRGEA